MNKITPETAQRMLEQHIKGDDLTMLEMRAVMEHRAHLEWLGDALVDSAREIVGEILGIDDFEVTDVDIKNNHVFLQTAPHLRFQIWVPESAPPELRFHHDSKWFPIRRLRDLGALLDLTLRLSQGNADPKVDERDGNTWTQDPPQNFGLGS